LINNFVSIAIKDSYSLSDIITKPKRNTTNWSKSVKTGETILKTLWSETHIAQQPLLKCEHVEPRNLSRHRKYL